MTYARRFAGAAAVLLVIAVAVPVLVPTRWEYHYSLQPAGDHDVDPSERERIEYRELSTAEQSLVDNLLRENGSVTRSSPIDGPRFAASTDGRYPTVIERDGRSYVFEAVREQTNPLLSRALPPLSLGLAAVLAACAVVALGRQYPGRRLERR